MGDPTKAEIAGTGRIDLVAQALALFASYLQDKPNLAALTGAVFVEVQYLEDAFQDLATYTNVNTAFGVTLDALGAVVGQPRAGESDDLYRVRVRARVRANRSSGTTEAIIGVFRALTNDLGDIQFVPFYPASFVLRLFGSPTDTDTANVYFGFLQDSKAAGVGASFEYSESALDDTFRLDVGPGLDVGHLAGDL